MVPITVTLPPPLPPCLLSSFPNPTHPHTHTTQTQTQTQTRRHTYHSRRSSLRPSCFLLDGLFSSVEAISVKNQKKIRCPALLLNPWPRPPRKSTIELTTAVSWVQLAVHSRKTNFRKGLRTRSKDPFQIGVSCHRGSLSLGRALSQRVPPSQNPFARHSTGPLMESSILRWGSFLRVPPLKGDSFSQVANANANANANAHAHAHAHAKPHLHLIWERFHVRLAQLQTGLALQGHGDPAILDRRLRFRLVSRWQHDRPIAGRKQLLDKCVRWKFTGWLVEKGGQGDSKSRSLDKCSFDKGHWKRSQRR